jgi:hypothetical protein
VVASGSVAHRPYLAHDGRLWIPSGPVRLASCGVWCSAGRQGLLTQPSPSTARPFLVYIFVMEDAEAATDEALRLQMEQAMELVRQMLGNIVQAIGFFIAADALLFGYGVSQKKSGVLLIASFTVVGIFVSVGFGLSSVGPAVYAALYVERLLLPNHITLVASLLRIKYQEIYRLVDTALSIQDIQQREQEIRRAFSFPSLLREIRTFQALSGMFLVQLGAVFLTYFVFNYSFF